MSIDVKDVVGTTRLAAASHAVEVHLPVRIGSDLEQFQEVQRRIFDRLGHSTCVSGFDIRWRFEERFVVDDDLAIRAF